MNDLHKSHNWKLVELADKCTYFWQCTDCGIEDVDPLAYKKCLKFNVLVHLVRKIIQLRKDLFNKVGTFILRF